MGASLYDKVFGFFDSGSVVNEINDKMQIIISVKDNISRILNSRAGSIKHLPDYGLPDMSLIYRSLPISAYDLMRAIQNTLLKYEPRLSAIEIVLQETDNTIILSYELKCHLKQGEVVKYSTHFMPDGKADISYTYKK